ncbi:hypothetical protein AJ80_00931 [Polytolypa hystricis UAMH7299]|uniref:DUF7918 domain-containing protein n=1 Tax=Polytolypa hystricis (strain UAMH7299) TaxID=1447883 RepID=A0A2B7Z320_POLH7|nr:hypothetical protein AJ80_00931 [Polytolypa hystricis UAMH7299]
MPCFKGLAVSIHTPDGPLPEHSVQRQSRASRIASYIPVPPPKIPDSSSGTTPEQSTFAISITLLTPGQNVPYSTPKPTPETPHPRPKVVGGRGERGGAIGPYQPLTGSPNETVAAYIYFDGRQKEEVATLLRRGEETWVNSRWVGVPESEGGGLAEREFLFREVGLERWLNGLDLDGKDAAAKIERRRQKMERRRRKREAANRREAGEDMELDDGHKSKGEQGVLRYGNNAQSPVENLSDDGEIFSSESEDDDDPIPETAGQIKVALFRVLASGEIKRGEYSPQFDAHDDDEDAQGGGANGKESGDADVDHTTSFAKPKTLDPKSISTQTVTGIDPSDKPYAIFTFMYRGERQLQKMGILNPKGQEREARRASLQPDFANLAPLKPGMTAGFVKFRDNEERSKSKKSSKGSESDMDSDDDGSVSIVIKAEDEEAKEVNSLLSPDDARQQGELAEGLRQIKLKRQHSAEPLSATETQATSATSKSPTPSAVIKQATTPPINQSAEAPEPSLKLLENDDAFVGSPLKKQRASVNADDELFRKRIGSNLSANIHGILGLSNTSESTGGENAPSLAPGGDLMNSVDQKAPDDEVL